MIDLENMTGEQLNELAGTLATFARYAARRAALSHATTHGDSKNVALSTRVAERIENELDAKGYVRLVATIAAFTANADVSAEDKALVYHFSVYGDYPGGTIGRYALLAKLAPTIHECRGMNWCRACDWETSDAGRAEYERAVKVLTRAGFTVE